MEILASGTPLVATIVGGIGAGATDRQTARLVPERDTGVLTAAIGGLPSEPPRRSEVGRQACEVVHRNDGWNRTAGVYETIYHNASS